MPLSTAPQKRLNSPRITDPNSQGTGSNHRVVRSRERASTDDPFKTTDFISQAYDPIVDEALADAHIPPHATRIHTTALHLLPRFPSHQAPTGRCSAQTPQPHSGRLAPYRQVCTTPPLLVTNQTFWQRRFQYSMH